jgi:hypothetical protein
MQNTKLNVERRAGRPIQAAEANSLAKRPVAGGAPRWDPRSTETFACLTATTPARLSGPSRCRAKQRCERASLLPVQHCPDYHANRYRRVGIRQNAAGCLGIYPPQFVFVLHDRPDRGPMQSKSLSLSVQGAVSGPDQSIRDGLNWNFSPVQISSLAICHAVFQKARCVCYYFAH